MDGVHQPVRYHRLGQRVAHSREEFADVFHVKARDDDDAFEHRGIGGAEVLHHLRAADFGQHDVEQHDVVVVFRKQSERAQDYAQY